MNMIPRVVQTISRRAVRNYGSPPAQWKPPTMNELPVPQGSWQADYNAKQRKYNMHLAAGIVSSLFTIAFVQQSGLIFFNWGPPELKKE